MGLKSLYAKQIRILLYKVCRIGGRKFTSLWLQVPADVQTECRRHDAGPDDTRGGGNGTAGSSCHAIPAQEETAAP